jgi:hypothetical protein
MTPIRLFRCRSARAASTTTPASPAAPTVGTRRASTSAAGPARTYWDLP